MTYIDPQWFEIFLLHWKKQLDLSEPSVIKAIKDTNGVYTLLLADKVEEKLEEK